MEWNYSRPPRRGRLLLLCDLVEGLVPIVGSYRATKHVGPRGPFCWRTSLGSDAIADKTVVAWARIPKVDKKKVKITP